MFEKNKLFFSLKIILLFLYLSKKSQEETQFDNVLFPTTLTLLNQNIAMVERDGIHFYSSELVEDTSKAILFEKEFSDVSESEKVAMAQFSEEDEGYILILTNEIIYFFESEGINIDNVDLTDIIDAAHYCLTPFKKEDNYLYYLISYAVVGGLTIKQFKFNINSHINELILSNNYGMLTQYYNSSTAIPNSIVGVSCIFMSISSIDHDIFTCFYSIYYPTEIQTKSFDPLNNFKELTVLFNYYFNGTDFPILYYISALTNQDKQNALIFCISKNPFWMTFNFKDSFSNHIPIFNDSSFLVLLYHKTKTYYFRQTHEFLFSSSYQGCIHFLMIFNNNLTLKSQVFSSPESCYDSFSHSVYFDGAYYNVVTDNGNVNNPKIFSFRMASLGISETVESLIIIEKNNAETFENNNTNLIIGTTVKTDILETVPILQTDINNNIPTTYVNIKTIISTSNIQDINQKTEVTIQTNINNDNILTYQSEETFVTNNENTQDIIQNIETTLIKKNNIESNNQNVNKIPETININGVSYPCTNEEFYNGKCDFDNNPLTKDDMVDKIRDDIINHKIDNILPNDVEKKEDIIIENNKTLYQITSSFNQNHKIYHNISSIKLGECEKILKDIYNLDNKTSLLIFKVDSFEEGLSIPIIEYEIYESINNTKLDLNYCKDLKINIDIPISIDERDLFKYNLSSDYYNDICIPATSENNTDITLNDRIDEFFDNNMSLCENNCTYNGYNLEIQKANCECDIKTEMNTDSESIFDKEKLLNYFLDIKSIINLDVLKCLKILFTNQGYINNYGNYIVLAIILFHIISLIYFLAKGFNLFVVKVESIIKNKKENKTFISRKKQKKKSIFFPPKKINLKSHNSRSHIDISKLNDDNLIESRIKIKLNHFKRSMNSKKQTKKVENINLKLKKVSIFKKRNTMNINIIKNIDKENLKYKNYELNLLKYEEAKKLDKRTFIQIYISLIRTKHLILFTFFNDNDYNIYIIKASLFFISFALYLTVNVLFFDDSTMHKIYEDEGKYDFIYQIPKILYSTIISSIINYIIKFLSLSEKNILELKYEKKNINKNFIKVIKCLNIKFIIFYLFTFILLIFFWFYLSCFCAVYINSQRYIIADASISFGLSLLYPFIFNIFSCVLRILSIKTKKNRKCIYKISQLI